MSMVGADVPALRQLCSALGGRARKIEATKNQITALVRDLPWVGTDRDRYVDQWMSIHQPNLIRLIDDLLDASARASRHADAQEAASRVGD
jgi:hypothetical protein